MRAFVCVCVCIREKERERERERERESVCVFVKKYSNEIIQKSLDSDFIYRNISVFKSFGVSTLMCIYIYIYIYIKGERER